MKTLLSLLAILVVCLAVSGAWAALEWCRSVERRCEALRQQVGEMELRIFELDQQHRAYVESQGGSYCSAQIP